MESEGFIKIYRKAFRHKFWTKAREFSEFEAWIDLLQSARVEETDVIRLIDGLEVKYGHAQYPASIRFLAKKWGWGEQKVRSFMNTLRKDNSISTDCSQGVNVITICKYDEYNTGKKTENSGYNTPSNTDISLLYNEIEGLKKRLATQGITQGQHTPNTNIKNGKNINIISPSIPQTGEAVTTVPDAGVNPGKEKEKTWRDDYNIYLALVRNAYRAIRDDKALLEKQRKYYPNVDIMLSIEKACTNYWATESGWKKKKSGRSKDIDMKMTLINAISINKVYNGTEQAETKRYDNGDYLR